MVTLGCLIGRENDILGDVEFEGGRGRSGSSEGGSCGSCCSDGGEGCRADEWREPLASASRTGDEMSLRFRLRGTIDKVPKDVNS